MLRPVLPNKVGYFEKENKKDECSNVRDLVLVKDSMFSLYRFLLRSLCCSWSRQPNPICL